MAIVKSGPLPRSTKYAEGGNTDVFTYKVVCNTTNENGHAIIAYIATKYGHYRGRWLTSTRFYCSAIEADQQTDGLIWKVTVTYVVNFNSSTPPGQDVTPLMEPWGITFGHTSKRQVLVHAYSKWIKRIYPDGDAAENPASPAATLKHAVLNSAGDAFDPGYEKDVRLSTFTLSKNISIAAYNSIKPLDYDDTLNSNQLVICGRTVPQWAGLIWVEGSRRVYVDKNSNPVLYMALSYTVTVDPDLWAVRLVDQGMRYKKRAAPNKDTMITATAPGMRDHRETKPIKLDGYGYAIADSPLLLSAVLQCFFDRRQMSWSPLDLPSTSSTE